MLNSNLPHDILNFWCLSLKIAKKKKKKIPSNHLKFDVPLETCLIPTDMKCNRCILVYIRSGGVIGHLWIMVYWGLTPQQQPGSYQGGEMMMKSVFWWRKPEHPEETTDLRQVTVETVHTYGLCPVRGLNLVRSGVKQSELRHLGHFIITVHFGVPKVVSSIKIKYFTDKFKFCVF